MRKENCRKSETGFPDTCLRIVVKKSRLPHFWLAGYLVVVETEAPIVSGHLPRGSRGLALRRAEVDLQAEGQPVPAK